MYFLKNVKGVATRSENSNDIVSVTSYLRKTIVTIAFVSHRDIVNHRDNGVR